ncbi:hypothetical protein [Sphingobium fuliginis]|jgi:hypothetical protein|uniref:hypothetical protein n=1 Tax=Sphingobium fuliginis (strain ATCC 27551) TaxID=336203 RepID=UPI0037C5B2FA
MDTTHMDTRFAKIVTDLNGRDHMLIEGHVISLVGPDDENNAMVDLIVRALRRAGRDDGEVIYGSVAASGGQ